MSRTIHLNSAGRCLVCSRPIVLFQGRGEFATFERDELLTLRPHQCPEEAVESWIRADAVARLETKSRGTHR